MFLKIINFLPKNLKQVKYWLDICSLTFFEPKEHTEKSFYIISRIKYVQNGLYGNFLTYTCQRTAVYILQRAIQTRCLGYVLTYPEVGQYLIQSSERLFYLLIDKFFTVIHSKVNISVFFQAVVTLPLISMDCATYIGIYVCTQSFVIYIIIY